MNNESRNQRNNVPETDKNKPNLFRRSLTKAGFVAPVIMSLANRPAWGLMPGCQISGYYSAVEIGSTIVGDTSCGYTSVGGILIYLEGRSMDGDQIDTIFDCITQAPDKNAKLKDILDPTFTTNDFLKWMVAAYFNAEPTAFNLNPLEPWSVRDVFCHFYTNGPNAPFDFGTVNLVESEVLTFLQAVIAPN